MTAFKFMLDSNRQNTYILQKSDQVWQVAAPADTLLELDVPAPPNPGQAYAMAIISSTNNFFVSNEPFDLVSSATFELGSAELNKPAMPLLNGNTGQEITTLYFMVREDCDITVSFFTEFVRNNNPLGD